jgi:hypothetical protein
MLIVLDRGKIDEGRFESMEDAIRGLRNTPKYKGIGYAIVANQETLESKCVLL